MQTSEDTSNLACPVPERHDDAEPPRQPVVMLVFRFLLELVAFGSIGLAGWRIGDGGILGGVLAAVGVILAATAWGALTVPDDPSRNPKAVMIVPGWLRIIVELVVFGVAAWSLWVYVSRAASETFMTAIGIMILVGWDRLWWMLKHR